MHLYSLHAHQAHIYKRVDASNSLNNKYEPGKVSAAQLVLCVQKMNRSITIDVIAGVKSPIYDRLALLNFS